MMIMMMRAPMMNMAVLILPHYPVTSLSFPSACWLYLHQTLGMQKKNETNYKWWNSTQWSKIVHETWNPTN